MPPSSVMNSRRFMPDMVPARAAGLPCHPPPLAGGEGVGAQCARAGIHCRPLLRIIPQPRHGPQRPGCVAGVGGLELRNVDANYPFERSHRFAGIEPNSGHGDDSPLSCSAADTQLGAGFCRDFQQAFCTDIGHHAASPRRHELAAISSPDQKMIGRRQSQQHHCSVCAGLSAQRERVW
jgi:hypothetical protein